MSKEPISTCVHGIGLYNGETCAECAEAAGENLPPDPDIGLGQYGAPIGAVAMMDDFDKNPIWICTNELRFVKRDGLRILQQKWLKQFSYDRDGEWRDVPLVEDGNALHAG